MFAGGGAIPLEALRLGCEAYALDLNPVAHIIQLCTLVYPQKYGKPDPAARGMTGPPAGVPASAGSDSSAAEPPKGGTPTVSAIDTASRFYVLWRFVYKAAEIDAGEAIVFTYAQHVELDGPLGLSTGKDALVEKKKAKYRARDFRERGDNDKMGLPSEAGGTPAPQIDVLHRVLWLLDNSPRKLGGFLTKASPDRERLRVLAQALVGASLSGKSEEDAEKLIGTTAAEKAALGKLLANWRSLIEHAIESPAARVDKKRGQSRMFE
jgi:hypothetical protein